MGNRQTYLKILRKFRENFNGADEKMRRFLSRGNYDQARSLAHTVKGTAGNVGADMLQKKASDLEAWIKKAGTGLPGSELDAFSNELKKVMASLSVLDEKKDSTPAAKEEAFTLPVAMAKDIAKRLGAALEVGDVMEMEKMASELISRQDAASQVGEKIRRLSEDFDFDALNNLVAELETAGKL